MSPPAPSLAPRAPVSIDRHAEEHLRVIRSAMERSATFTAVPGTGGIAMGLIAWIAAFAAASQPTSDRWLLVWIMAAIVAASVGLITMARKARRAGSTLASASARRFGIALGAPMVAGAALTFALWSTRAYSVMAPAWLLLYGTAVLVGGAYSVAAIRITGVLFMLLGIAATVTMPAWGNVWLGAGFGALHIASGWYIWRHHGG